MAEQTREAELQRAMRALAKGDDAQKVLTQLSRGLTNKLIHAPTAGLKEVSSSGRPEQLAVARRVLGLESAEPETSPEPEQQGTADSAAEHGAEEVDRGGHTLQ